MDFNAIKPKSERSFTYHDDYTICDTQGKLFHLASEMGFDEKDFTEKYMQSKFCNQHIDTECDYYQTADIGYNMQVLLDEISPSKSQTTNCPASMQYIGHMYQYLHRRSGIPSHEIYKRFSFEKMEAYCLMSINEDTEETLYNIMEDYGGIFPEVKTNE